MLLLYSYFTACGYFFWEMTAALCAWCRGSSSAACVCFRSRSFSCCTAWMASLPERSLRTSKLCVRRSSTGFDQASKGTICFLCNHLKQHKIRNRRILCCFLPIFGMMQDILARRPSMGTVCANSKSRASIYGSSKLLCCTNPAGF